jgi:hypothetical protein
MNTNDIKDVCKTLHLAYIADHYEDIPFENKQQFLSVASSLHVRAHHIKTVAYSQKEYLHNGLQYKPGEGFYIRLLCHLCSFDRNAPFSLWE